MNNELKRQSSPLLESAMRHGSGGYFDISKHVGESFYTRPSLSKQN